MARFYCGQVLLWPGSTVARFYCGQVLLWPGSTLARFYFGQVLLWPGSTLARFYLGQVRLRPIFFLRGGGPNQENVEGLKGWGGGPKVGGPKFRAVFLSFATIFAFFFSLWESSRVFLFSLWGSSRGILVGFLKDGTLKCARLGSRAVV